MSEENENPCNTCKNSDQMNNGITACTSCIDGSNWENEDDFMKEPKTLIFKNGNKTEPK